MYFSKQKLKWLYEQILKNKGNLYLIEMNSSLKYKLEDLENGIKDILATWRIISNRRGRGYIKNYHGIIRRLIIKYDNKDDSFQISLLLFCMLKTDKVKRIVDIDIRTYTNWYKAWSTTGHYNTNIVIICSPIDKAQIETELHEYCHKPTLIIDQSKMNSIKLAEIQKNVKAILGKEKLVTLRGIFSGMNHVEIIRGRQK